MKFYIVCVILISCFSYAYSYVYKAIPRNVDLFSPCENQPENVLDFNGFADLSSFHMDYNENGEIVISGNATTIWDIQPTDSIKTTASIMRFDRGSWVQTPYSVMVPNICPVLYVKNDIWYDAWIKHVINAEQIQNKCFQRGTQFVHETYVPSMLIHSRDSEMEGFHKIQIKYHAISSLKIERLTSICFELQGDLERE